MSNTRFEGPVQSIGGYEIIAKDPVTGNITVTWRLGPPGEGAGFSIGSDDSGIDFQPTVTTPTPIAAAVLPYNVTTDMQTDNTLNLGSAAARYKDLYVAGGIRFGPEPTTPVASNYLNDYEEGSVTLTMGGGTSNPTTTQSTGGQYIKVGMLVTVWFKFSNKNNTGAAGVVQVNGLPFTVSSLVDGYGTAWGGRDGAGGTGHKAYEAGVGTTSAKMIDGAGNNVSWSGQGSSTYQGGVITYRT